MDKRPNILWICSDQQRSDTIGAMGNPFIDTPVLDKLCGEGTGFKNCYAQSPMCTPSRAAMLTGRYCSSYHVFRNGNDKFPESEILVTKLLANDGYTCGLVGKLHLSTLARGREKPPDDGFSFRLSSHSPLPAKPEFNDYAKWLRDEKKVDLKEIYGQMEVPVGKGIPEEYHQTTWCAEKAMAFIEDNQDKTWLLRVDPFDPHPPMDPPKEYMDKYMARETHKPFFGPDDIVHQELFEAIDQQSPVARDYDAIGGEPDDDPEYKKMAQGLKASYPPKNVNLKKMVACYYGMIDLIDKQVGRILQKLEDLGLRENTMVIFTSDHGDLLGDHGLLYKGCRFFESLIHIPLIISWPGTYQKGVKAAGLVEQVDLAPTILEAAGMDVPYPMQGKSLHAMLKGDAPADRHKPFVISEYNSISPPPFIKPKQSHGFMYFDGRYKVILYEDFPRGEIYDLEEDPNEGNDLWDDKAFAELKTTLLFETAKAQMKAVSPGDQRLYLG